MNEIISIPERWQVDYTGRKSFTFRNASVKVCNFRVAVAGQVYDCDKFQYVKSAY